MPDAERETGWRSLVEIAKGQTEMSGASPGTSEFTDSFSRYSPHLNWLLKTALAMIAIGIGCMVLGAVAL